MHRIDSEDSQLGFFVEGDPQTDDQGSVVTADWLNDVQEAIVAVILAAGLPLTKGRANDLLDAIHQRIEAFTGTPLVDLTALRAYTGTQRKVLAVRGTPSYYWFADLFNVTATDDGVTCVIDANGLRWRPRPVAGGLVYDDGSNLQVLQPADAGATNRKTFTQNSPPANPASDLHTGDIWVDSDDGNKQYRWNGSAWISIQDAGADTGRELALHAAANGKTIEQVVLDAAAGAEGSPIAGINVRRWEGTWSTAQRSHVIQVTVDKALGRITVAHKGLNGHSGTATIEMELEVSNNTLSSYTNIDGETSLVSAPGGVNFATDTNKWGPNGLVWSETFNGGDTQDSFRVDLTTPANIGSTLLRLKLRQFGTTDTLAVSFIAMGDTPIMPNPPVPLQVQFTVTDTTSIDALVLTNGPAVPGADTRASTIGIRQNYSSWGTPNDGEAFVHGFGPDGSPADANGFFIHNGLVHTVDRTVPIYTGSVGRGWIVYDTAVGTPKFTVNGTPSRIAFAVKRGGGWFYDDNTSTRVSFTPAATDAVIGTMWADTADHLKEATIWPYGMALGIVPEADATNRRTFTQASPPNAVTDELGPGDLWYDSDDGYKQYRWSGSAWVLTRDAGATTGQELADALAAAGLAGSVALVAAASAGSEAYPGTNFNVTEWYTSPYSPSTAAAMIRIRIDRPSKDVEIAFGGYAGHTGSASVDMELEVYGNTIASYTNSTAETALTFSASPIDFGTPNRWASNGIRWTESATGTDTDVFKVTLTNVPGVGTAFRLRVRSITSASHPTQVALGSLLLGTDLRTPLLTYFTASDGTDYDVLTMVNAPVDAGATNRKTFTQASPPANPGDNLHTGDLWNDSDDGNKQYRWNGSSWVSVQDSGAAAGAALSSELSGLGTTITSIAGTASIASESVPLGAVNVVEWYTSPYSPVGDAAMFRIRIDRPNRLVEVQLSVHGSVTATSIDVELEVYNNTFTAYTNVNADTSLTFSASPINFGTANQWASNGIRWTETGSSGDVQDRFTMTLNTVPGASTGFRLRMRSASVTGGSFHVALGDLLLFVDRPVPWVTLFSPTDGANYDVLVMQNAPADAGATKRQTFNQASPPSNPGDDLHTGDLWNDSDDGNKQYRWNGSAWISIQDAMIVDAVSDGILTPSDKVTIVPGIKDLVSSQSGLNSRASAYGITTENTAFNSAMTTLNNYLATLTSSVAWDNQSGNTTVSSPSTFVTNYRTALEARSALQRAIETSLGAAILDGILSPGEKATTVPLIKELVNGQAGLNARASAFGVTTENTNFNTSMTTLNNYLATLTTPVAWDSQSGNTTIAAPATFIANYQDALDKRAALQRALETALGASISDGILTPGEKVTVVPGIKDLINTATVLDTRAAALGITTERTALSTAISTLTSYLGTLTSPVAWDDQSGNTTIAAPATFITNHRTALEARVNLIAKIDELNANVLVGLGVNGAVNSEFRNGLVGWEWGWDGNGGATPVRSLVTGGINYVQAVVTGTPANNTVFDIIETDRSTASYYWNGVADPATIRASFLQCKAGDRIFAVAPVAYENAQHVILALLFYDQAGTYLSETGLGAGGTNGFPTGGNPALFTPVGGFATAPANTAYVGLYARVLCSGAANPKGYVGGRVQLCVVPAGQTAWPPYSPGPSDKAATNGAVIGTNLLRPDATLPGIEDIDNAWSAFSVSRAWNFENASDVGVTGWAGVDATTSVSGGVLLWQPTTTDAQLISLDGLGINGATENIIRIRARPLAASPTFEGVVYYATNAHYFSGGYYKVISNPGIVQNQWQVFEWDMRDLTAGGTDWITRTIRRIRIDITNSQQDWEFDWIAIGSRSAEVPQVSGGVNLIKRTDWTPGYSYTLAAYVASGVANGKSGWGITLSKTTGNTAVAYSSYKAWPSGREFTLSFIAWISAGVATITTDLYPDTLPELPCSLTTTPTRFQFTINSSHADMANATWRFFCLDAQADGDTITITDLQMEYGPIASEWMPPVERLVALTDDGSSYMGAAKQLQTSAAMQQLSGDPRQLLHSVVTFSTYDGQTYTFPRAYPTVPKVRGLLGGKQWSPALNNLDSQYRETSFVATTTGVTVTDKLKETVGTPTLQTQSTWSTINENRSEAHKPTSADAWNGLYKVGATIRVYRAYLSPDEFSGSVTVAFLTNDGGGWVQRASLVLDSYDTIAGYDDYVINYEFYSGAIGQHAGTEVAIEIIAEDVSLSKIQAMGDLTYYTATAPAQVAGSSSTYPIKAMAYLGDEEI